METSTVRVLSTLIGQYSSVLGLANYLRDGRAKGGAPLFFHTLGSILNYLLRPHDKKEVDIDLHAHTAATDRNKPESEHKVTDNKEVSSKSICGLTNSAILITSNRCIKLFYLFVDESTLILN